MAINVFDDYHRINGTKLRPNAGDYENRNKSQFIDASLTTVREAIGYPVVSRPAPCICK